MKLVDGLRIIPKNGELVEAQRGEKLLSSEVNGKVATNVASDVGPAKR